MFKQFKSWSGMIASTVALVALLTVTPPAKAIIWTGAWDPAFGSAFPNLGWRGEATFFLPDACLAEQGWVFNFESCSAFGMKILSAEVEFYKLSDPADPAFHETLLFDVPSSAVLSMNIDDGVLTGVLGTFLYSRPSTLPIAGGPYTDFVLFFEDNLARMGFVSSPPNGPRTSGFSDKSPSDGSPFITFRVVPEPGSWSLLLLAATTGLLMRRSRRVQPAA
jgi:hypothetical protein